MRVSTLRTALGEYRPSLTLRVLVMGEKRFDMTVVEMISNLMSVPDSDHVTLFGSTDFIIRERNVNFAATERTRVQPELPFPPTAPNQDYIEIDVRL